MADRSYCRSVRFDPDTAHLSQHGGKLVAFVFWLAERWKTRCTHSSGADHEAIVAYDFAVLDLNERLIARSRVSNDGDPEGDP